MSQIDSILKMYARQRPANDRRLDHPRPRCRGWRETARGYDASRRIAAALQPRPDTCPPACRSQRQMRDERILTGFVRRAGNAVWAAQQEETDDRFGQRSQGLGGCGVRSQVGEKLFREDHAFAQEDGGAGQNCGERSAKRHSAKAAGTVKTARMKQAIHDRRTKKAAMLQNENSESVTRAVVFSCRDVCHA